MDEKQILDRVGALVQEEHTLRERYAAGQLGEEEEQIRLRELE